MRNLKIATQLITKGSVLWIPEVKFSTGVTKSKYCIALEDGNAFWKKGHCILACLTTSKTIQSKGLKPWQVPVAPQYKILGEHQKKTTYIDCRNRIHLKEAQIKKCKLISYLPDEILILVNNANQIAESYERMT